jgi:diaminopimelate epimerase
MTTGDPSAAVSGRTQFAELSGLPFTKMTGSGNDFVFFDGREVPIDTVTRPEVIRAICHRHNGIGADGLVVLEPRTGDADVRIHFYNADGTSADLCGNATLCSTALSAAVGMAPSTGMCLSTGSGLIHSKVQGLPSIELQPVLEVRPHMPVALVSGERQVGFAIAGVPHLVILCDNAESVDVAGRGPALRWHESTGPAGANVNWVSSLPDGRWRYRTFERGVEGETLACGTGAVATAILLTRWGHAASPTIAIQTSSGRDLLVTLDPVDPAGVEGFRPRLEGEGRVVFRGRIEAL